MVEELIHVFDYAPEWVYDALMYSYNMGQNYIDTSYIYAGGQTMRFISEFLKRVDRNKLFITVKIENYIEEVADIEKQLDKYLNVMGIEYADSILLHTPRASKIPLAESYRELKRLVSIGKNSKSNFIELLCKRKTFNSNNESK